ncbi:MAG: leucyl/phenylalanyl-tRNA--protein transferase [Phycisphaera sp.]|nr:leucyl/phenylalanyl-tRNA--protein transferase [Phycisphaera sp.]
MYYYAGRANRLDPDTVLAAYARGLFAMGEEDGSVHWLVSDPRFVLPIGGLHVPRSLARSARKAPFEFRVDTAFRRVMELCAEERGGTNLNWIAPRMIDVYTELQEAGFAHSVEAWKGGVLVGGLYGVALGGAFFGESMFSRLDLGGSNASKLCLLELDRRLQRGGYLLLDSQERNEHMSQFGGEDLPFDAYLERLVAAVEAAPDEAVWRAD